MTDVLVVGAGPTGLTMAIELKRRGIDVRCVEKLEVPSDKSRALVVHARTLELMQKIGLAEQLIERGKRAIGVSLVVEGKEATRFDLGDIAANDTPYPNLLMISQAETEKVLGLHVTALGVKVERGVSLTKAVDDGAGVNATLSTGEIVRAKYVVGCDGAHSQVRQDLGLAFEGAAYEQEFVLGDVQVDEASWPHALDRFILFFSHTGLLAQFPMRAAQAGHTYTRFIASRLGHRDTEAGTKKAGTEPISLPELQSIARATSGTNVTFKDAVWLAKFRLHHRGVDRYRKGRMFVAGDAAHIHSPVGGQGMNTGIQDAWNLGWKLALVLKNKAPEALLDTYHDERYPVGQFLLKRTDRLFSLVTADSKLAIAARNFGAPLIAKLVAQGPERLRKMAFRFMSQLAIRYEPNRFIADGAGWRGPDAKIEGGTLFEATRGLEHHLLAFGHDAAHCATLARKGSAGMPPGFAKIIPIFGGPAGLAGSAFERYSIANEALVLLRPDGHVAFIGHGEEAADALVSYLAAWRAVSQ